MAPEFRQKWLEDVKTLDEYNLMEEEILSEIRQAQSGILVREQRGTDDAAIVVVQEAAFEPRSSEMRRRKRSGEKQPSLRMLSFRRRRLDLEALKVSEATRPPLRMLLFRKRRKRREAPKKRRKKLKRHRKKKEGSGTEQNRQRRKNVWQLLGEFCPKCAEGVKNALTKGEFKKAKKEITQKEWKK